MREDAPEAYEELVAGFREERTVRHEVIRRRTSAQIRFADRGQIGGFVVVTIFVVACGIAAIEGHVVGLAGIVAVLVPIITVLVLGRSRDDG